MPFIKIKGFEASIYVPEENRAKQKHSCRDCFSCQFCSDERCGLCLKKAPGKNKSVPKNSGTVENSN